MTSRMVDQKMVMTRLELAVLVSQYQYTRQERLRPLPLTVGKPRFQVKSELLIA